MSPYYLKFAKDLLRAPIKDIIGLYPLKAVFIQGTSDFYEGWLSTAYSRMPRVRNKMISYLKLAYNSRLDEFAIFVEYYGELFKIEGSRCYGLKYIQKYKSHKEPSSFLYKWKLVESYDREYIIAHQNQNILELGNQ